MYLADPQTRQVWYSRDDSEGVAASINQLMPPGTETSLAMPVFDFSGQVAFAIVACWTTRCIPIPMGLCSSWRPWRVACSLLVCISPQQDDR